MDKLPNESLLKPILINYMNAINGVLAVAICDRNGFIISSEFKEQTTDESVIGVISAIIDSFIDRIKSEFGTYGNFFNITTTGDRKFSFASMGPHSILTTVADPLTSDVELKVYSEHIASKIELILEGNEDVSPQIPEIIKALSKTRGGQLSLLEGEFSNKLILTGDYAVGKTSLIRRFVENKFEQDYISTIGVQISKKIVNISEKTTMNFLIWDIGGQKNQMAPYRKKFYSGTNAAFIVIDRTRPGNLKSINYWFNDIKEQIPKDIPIIIVGNKSDLVDDIVISEDDMRSIAKEFGFHYILTSAKTGIGVNDAFLYVAYRVIETL
ncbi:MAG: GTP-binding protein [Candidatus Hodarchaeota archaeon]